jgi:hypothetical protein
MKEQAVAMLQVARRFFSSFSVEGIPGRARLKPAGPIWRYASLNKVTKNRPHLVELV